MSRIFLNIIFILLVSTLLSACIKTLDDKDMPQVESKLVIGGYISPQDTIIRIFVRKSSPINNQSEFLYSPVTDANVLLSGNGVSATLVFNERLSSYTVPASQFPIVPGGTYHLTVSTPAGLYAEAETTVPQDINSSLTYNIDTVERSNNYGYSGKSIEISVRWNDIQNQDNYYRVYGETGVLYDPILYPNQYAYHYNLQFNTKATVFKDLGYENGNIGPFKAEMALQDMNNQSRDVSLSLLNTDRNYYEFYKSYEMAVQEDPFSEPQNIYTNIKGGLGIFASYQKYEIKLMLK